MEGSVETAMKGTKQPESAQARDLNAISHSVDVAQRVDDARFRKIEVVLTPGAATSGSNVFHDLSLRMSPFNME